MTNIKRTYQKLLFVLVAALILLPVYQSYATFYIGGQGHSAIIMNDSAKNHFENPGWGGSVHVFYSPEFFLGDFIALGLRQSYTHFEGKDLSNAASHDTLFAARVALLDTPFEDWTWDFVAEGGLNYFKASPDSADNKLHFTYAIGTDLRYFLFSESALGTFLRWHQTLGNFTLATGTSMTNLNLFEIGLFYEFSL